MIPNTPARAGLKQFLGCWLALAAAAACCQTPTQEPDWKELDAPAPPTYSLEGLLSLEMPRYVTLQFGVDPKTLTVGSDGVVRYVIVMRNQSGSVNAVYEGIRCATDEVKTYARSSTANRWAAVEQPQWKPMTETVSRHALAFAKQGACQDHTTPEKPRDIIRTLQRGTRLYD